MMNEEDKREVDRMIKSALDKQGTTVIHQSRFVAKSIKQRHIQDTIIRFGLAADRPSDGGAVGVLGYFATDSGVLSLWGGSAWLTTTLT